MDEVDGKMIEMSEGKRRIIKQIWKEERLRDLGMRGDIQELDGVRFEEKERL